MGVAAFIGSKTIVGATLIIPAAAFGVDSVLLNRMAKKIEKGCKDYCGELFCTLTNPPSNTTIVTQNFFRVSRTCTFKTCPKTNVVQ